MNELIYIYNKPESTSADMISLSSSVPWFVYHKFIAKIIGEALSCQ
jgi:hypothetical protein